MICESKAVPIGKLWIKKNRIDLNPPYQREASIWSEDKQQLFIDSVLNGYDVPKLYFHDRSDENGPFSDSVVDGKQRLSTIWNFMEGKFSLANDFVFSGDDSFLEDEIPQSCQSYEDFSDSQKEYFRGQSMDVVSIKKADDDDIEELFSRLNNGEPLNSAEKRNAMGGNMIKLVREIAKLNKLTSILSCKNKRMSYHEIAAKTMKMELSEQDGHGIFCDIGKKHLDQMIVKNRDASESELDGLKARVSKQLNHLNRVFRKNDPLLNRQTYLQLYYGWIKFITKRYNSPSLHKDIRSFLESFQVKRHENLQKAEDDRDNVLLEYGRLAQQGTNNLASMQERADILTRYFLEDYPDLGILDKSRQFNEVERHLIWVRSGKMCQNPNCDQKLDDLGDMHADHIEAWSKGGQTCLSNAQALCVECNLRKSSI